jgi:hypothetical protein
VRRAYACLQAYVRARRVPDIESRVPARRGSYYHTQAFLRSEGLPEDSLATSMEGFSHVALGMIRDTDGYVRLFEFFQRSIRSASMHRLHRG